jgi:hypothetical protein
VSIGYEATIYGCQDLCSSLGICEINKGIDRTTNTMKEFWRLVFLKRRFDKKCQGGVQGFFFSAKSCSGADIEKLLTSHTPCLTLSPCSPSLCTKDGNTYPVTLSLISFTSTCSPRLYHTWRMKVSSIHGSNSPILMVIHWRW